MGRVRYNQSGYCGQSRSIRAAIAEDEGKLPLTRAVKELARLAGVTQKTARTVLLEIGPCEWHHTGKYASATDYYDVYDAIDRLDPLYEEIDDARVIETCGLGWLDLQSLKRPMEPADWIADDDLRELERSESARIADEIHRMEVAVRIQHAVNFRAWNSTLRRIAENE